MWGRIGNGTADRVRKVTYRDIFLDRAKSDVFGHKKELRQEPACQTKISHGGTTMLAITVVVAAAGLALGLRFNVFVLALLLIVAIIGVSAIGVWGGSNLLVVALRVLATLACLQIGYLIGSLIAAQLPARVINRTQTQYVRRVYGSSDSHLPSTASRFLYRSDSRGRSELDF